MDADEHYVLASDDKAADRLALQHTLFKPSSTRLLKNAGIAEGMKVLEIGCGTGLMTPFLAESVGKSGRVLAIDVSPKFLDAAKRATDAYTQVQIQHHDAYQLNTLNQSFDLIYIRMLLHHLPDPATVLQQAIDSLNPNGILVCEECPCIANTTLYPESNAFNRFADMVIQVFDKNPSDYKIAYTMAAQIERAGLTVLEQGINQPILDHQHRALHLMAIRDFKPRAIALGIATEAEIDNLHDELARDLATADHVPLFKLIQISAQRQ